ncbi:DUF6480 family protein [Streptomyces sp. OfavH-34-F]|uniref:DUF6480 family protein n=1 Tax=unclassified Streptomyces TaxID=2593676 RepID=UPI001EF359C9|nr:DUF6480 family protein [Streptomyces sp. OfavH-34-F]MCG7523084.1 DUF6480 family protein [Streptomyces sp. OfavH-34-F]
MTPSQTPDPEPRPGDPAAPPERLVPPGETPPAEGSLSGAGPQDTTYNPPKGWAKGPLVLIAAVVLLVAAFFLVYAIILLV